MYESSSEDLIYILSSDDVRIMSYTIIIANKRVINDKDKLNANIMPMKTMAAKKTQLSWAFHVFFWFYLKKINIMLITR